MNIAGRNWNCFSFGHADPKEIPFPTSMFTMFLMLQSCIIRPPAKSARFLLWNLKILPQSGLSPPYYSTASPEEWHCTSGDGVSRFASLDIRSMHQKSIQLEDNPSFAPRRLWWADDKKHYEKWINQINIHQCNFGWLQFFYIHVISIDYKGRRVTIRLCGHLPNVLLSPWSAWVFLQTGHWFTCDGFLGCVPWVESQSRSLYIFYIYNYIHLYIYVQVLQEVCMVLFHGVIA